MAGYLRAWLAGAELTLRPRTYERYEQVVRLHLVPRLGRRRLSRLLPAHLRELYRDLLVAGSRQSRSTTPTP